MIEAKIKPSKSPGRIAQTAFGEAPSAIDRGLVKQAILAVGQQDIDPSGLRAPTGIDVMGASSDHLILESDRFELSVGAEVIFQLNYSALLRAMTSPYVTKVWYGRYASSQATNLASASLVGFPQGLTLQTSSQPLRTDQSMESADRLTL